ncbi:MAG TPA: hypothetical protein VMT23_02660 [Candidatus Binatia bacterium]|nr:hypothetical protein [Candidatus Binatia bacterium]
MNSLTYRFGDWLRQLPRQTFFPFLVIFLISGLVCLTSLRHNNSTMLKLRNEVYTADKNNTDVNAALNNLRDYVYAHMNTNLSTGTNIKPPIQLKYTYQRLEAAAQQQASNSGLYTEAENYCQSVIPGSVSFYGAGRISCVTDYINSHGGKSVAPIPVALYEFDFKSPTWSPDLAGWSLVVVILSAAGAIIIILISQIRKLLK